MLSQAKIWLLVAVVAAAVMVPLYGDPSAGRVTHQDWARLLLHALDLESGVRSDAPPAAVFAALSWKNTLALRADQYSQADGVQVVTRGVDRAVVAQGGVGQVVYPLSVVRPGDYRFRVRMSGNPAAPGSAEVAPSGKTAPLHTFTLVAGVSPTWVDAGYTHLDPGAYTTSVLLPAGAALDHLEIAPPCLSPVEPLGGWRTGAILQTSELATTVVKALDKENELPPAATAIEIPGEALQPSAPRALAVAHAEHPALYSAGLSAGPQGLEAGLLVNIPEPGLYSVDAFGVRGGGQSWMVDSCRKAVLCAGADLAASASSVPVWQHVLTSRFAPGRHDFSVRLASGGTVQRLRLERKKETAADYVATARRLGFDSGAEGPASRATVDGAMRFVQDHRGEVLGGRCGDIALPSGRTDVALAEPAPVSGPGRTPRFAGPGQPPLLGPDTLEPSSPASPTQPTSTGETPGTTPGPEPSPSPVASPAPVVTPPSPPTLASPEPASPVSP